MFVPDQPKAPTDEPAHNTIIIKINPTPKIVLRIIATAISVTKIIIGVNLAVSS